MELPDPVRQRLGNFSRTMFSDSNRTGPEYSEGPDNEMVSSLALQMSLYFNAYFFPLWWVSSITMLQVKVNPCFTTATVSSAIPGVVTLSIKLKYILFFKSLVSFTLCKILQTCLFLCFQYSVLPDYYKFIVVTVIILVTLIEVIRLYLGYMGNLQEKVPELAGFWLLSLLLQLPLILFLLFNEGLTNLPLEKAVHIIFTTFLTFQVISAFLTMRKMVNQLATRFHLQDFDRLSESRGGMRRMRSCLEEI
ncbi:transmembrane protein 17 isoform X1 [Camelus bactrianus]|uniref:Transmembrane protein 17 isoform X1 n=1 Tax=Camelus bactrianus TaxID=9837 RepID=A0AC58NHP8_CAMBA